jgi:transcriptional regulator with PAS, ATPase and Fis domain
MRSDFYFRIHVIPIHLPPLRDRGDDILLLIDFFLRLYNKSGKQIELTPEETETLRNYHWPGNVRELQNVIRRYIALRNLDFLSHDTVLKEVGQDLAEAAMDSGNRSLAEAVDNFEKEYITRVLKNNRWQKGKSAEALDISRKTLFRKMKRYQIE